MEPQRAFGYWTPQPPSDSIPAPTFVREDQEPGGPSRSRLFYYEGRQQLLCLKTHLPHGAMATTVRSVRYLKAKCPRGNIHQLQSELVGDRG